MQIGELADHVGVNIQTVRFYERKGLLPPAQRTESGYRQYGPEDLHRLRFIRQAKSLGFALSEIKNFLRLRSRGQCPCSDVIKVAEQHLRQVTEQISQLTHFRDELARALRHWKKSGRQQIAGDEFCALIERTIENAKAGKNKR